MQEAGFLLTTVVALIHANAILATQATMVPEATAALRHPTTRRLELEEEVVEGLVVTTQPGHLGAGQGAVSDWSASLQTRMGQPGQPRMAEVGEEDPVDVMHCRLHFRLPGLPPVPVAEPMRWVDMEMSGSFGEQGLGGLTMYPTMR